MPESNVAPRGAGKPQVRAGHAHPGRRPTTNRRELERVAIALFAEGGFDRTTVDDIARAAGIGRRTFFRYFESKNDVIWGEFDEQLARMRAAFAALPDGITLMEGIRRVVVEVNRYGRDDLTDLHRRMSLIAATPALRAHSTLRYDAWRGAVADYVARRLGQASTDLLPATVAGATLGVATAAYAHWLGGGAGAIDLPVLMASALDRLSSGFGSLGASSGETPSHERPQPGQRDGANAPSSEGAG
jgi:mycofactocin system transcriptional regulator